MFKVLRVKYVVVLFVLAVFTLAGTAYADKAEKININKATAQELVQLKGIGQKYAERIIEYRESHGKFEKIEDIMNIKGIGQKKYEKIKDLISVE